MGMRKNAWLAASLSLAISACSQGFHAKSSDGQDGASSSSSLSCKEVVPPRRVWTLSRTEYDNSVLAVLGNSSNQARATFPGENRANGFTSNPQSEVVDSTLIGLLMTAAETIAAQGVNKELSYISATLSCTLAANPSASSPDPCVTKYISTRGAAFARRPLAADEISGLYATYMIGFNNPYPSTAATASGIELVVTTLLESPQFYYRTELGAAGDTSNQVQLTQYEIASAISFIATGSPPDATLMAAADGGNLSSATAIATQFQRLQATQGGHAQVEEMIMEWLNEDQIAAAGQSSGPLTSAIAADMKTETQSFIEEAVFNGSGTVNELLTGKYTFLNSGLAGYYGISSSGSAFAKVTLDASVGRAGLLSQGAFLVTNSKSGVPLLHRGRIIRNKVLCETLPSFAAVGLAGFTPPPFQTPPVGTTTRHALTSEITGVCYTCHQYFMPIGYGLEHFDPFAQYQTVQNGGNIDSSGLVAESTSVDPADGSILNPQSSKETSFSDYLGLTATLASHPRTNRCFSAQLTTFTSGRGDVMWNDCAAEAVQAASSGGSSATIQQQFLNYVQSKYFTRRAR